MSPEYRAFYGSSEWVDLSDEEITAARDHGLKMREVSRANGHKNRRGLGANPKSECHMKRLQALGALAEAAASKSLFGKVSLRSEIFGEADLPGDVEVKLIGVEHYGLRVYPDTPDHYRIVGVVIPKGCERAGRFRLAGWIVAEAGKRAEFCMAPHGGPPMWAVPQDHLRPVRELRELVGALT